MKQGMIWGVVFAVIAVLTFPFIAPLIFRGADMRELGATALPALLVIGSAAGFLFGFVRSRRKS